jgi:surface protein
MEEWVEKISSATGKTYLFNTRTGVSKWKPEESSLARGIETLPEGILILIIERIFSQNLENISLSINAIINSRYFNLINVMLKKNTGLFCFMRTPVLLRMLLTMGYNLDDGTFTKDKSLPWHTEIIESQRNAIKECQYTSRAHDLLDIFHKRPKKPKRNGKSIKITKSGKEVSDADGLSRMAELILFEMHENERDPFGKMFLRGLTDVVSETNETIHTSIYRVEPENIKYLDVRKVTTMKYLFSDKLKDFGNIDLTYWDTSNVIDMTGLFSRNPLYSITGIQNWNTCRVKNMEEMFFGCNYFNEDIGNWNTSSVKDMSSMFKDCIWFNRYIGNWDTKNVEMTYSMFEDARNFNRDISRWNIDKIIIVMGMFFGATAFHQSVANGTIQLPRVRIRSNLNQNLEIRMRDTLKW